MPIRARGLVVASALLLLTACAAPVAHGPTPSVAPTAPATSAPTPTPQPGPIQCQPFEHHANGICVANTPAATPSPTPPDPMAIPVFGYDFWAGDTQVDYYPVTGRTEETILASIARNGPYSAWIAGHAEAETTATYRDYWYLEPLGDGSCRVVRPPMGDPVSISFVVTLPEWKQPSAADPSVVRWWVSELTADAEHENHHIELYETYVKLMNGVVRDGNCATIPDAIQSLRNQVATAQCEYDLDEYGRSLGLTLDSCLTHLQGP